MNPEPKNSYKRYDEACGPSQHAPPLFVYSGITPTGFSGKPQVF
jgi:hypothetical protein